MSETITTAPEKTDSRPERNDSRMIREKALAAKEAVADLAGEVKSYASDQIGRAKSQASEKIRGANDSVVNFVQKNPYTSLAIAAGTGLVVGMLVKRR